MAPAANLETLRGRMRQIEAPARHGVLPFDVAAIDRALPGGGLMLGAVHEIQGQGGDEEDGAAAAGFVAGILARLGPMERGGPVLWCLKRPDLYGPGLRAHGLDPARLVLVCARRDDEILWAIEEGLRTPGLAAVVAEIVHLPMVAGRRLQLAAERSGVTALLLRRWRNSEEAASERERPSAALTRWRGAALASRDILGEPRIGKSRWPIELLRCRVREPAAWEVEVADATGHVSLSAGLADRPAASLERKTIPTETEPFRRAG